MRFLTTFVLIVGLFLLAVPAVQASPLGLAYEVYPDISNFYIQVDYVYNSGSGTGALTAAGYPFEYDDDGLPGNNHAITGIQAFNLSATITPAGNPAFVSSITGTMSVAGDIDDFGIGNGHTGNNLLNGNVTDIGFIDGGGDIFDFLISLTASDMATGPYFGPPGTLIGIAFDANFPAATAFDGNWTHNFTNLDPVFGFADGNADIKAIPEPATLALLLAGISLMRRRAA